MAIFGVGEKQLVARAQRQDAAAVKAIYDAHVQYLSGVCRRYISSDEDAKDVLQESLVKIFSRLGSFSWQGAGSLRAWMRRIVVNEALMYLRRRGTGQEDSVEVQALAEEIPSEEDPDTDGVPLEVLQRMIRSLPEGYRTVFNLYVFEERPHKEIAALLGISEGTSYSQFSRAKAMLVQKIKDYRKGMI